MSASPPADPATSAPSPQRSSPSPPSTSRRPAARWALRLALLVGSLVAAELALRLVLALAGVPQSPAAIREELASLLGHFGDQLPARLVEREGLDPIRKAERRMPHPYLGWETLEGLELLERHGAETAEERARIYDVWLVGGSVAYLFGRSGGAERLRELLQADARCAGKTVRLQNYAHTEYKEPQQVLLVCYLLSLGLAPDAVIALDGYNEAAIGTRNAALGTHPVYPSIVGWSAVQPPPESDLQRERIRGEVTALRGRAESVGRLVREHGLARSALLGRAAVLYVQRLQARWARGIEEYAEWIRRREDDLALRGPRIGGKEPEAVLETVLTNFEQSSRTLHAICADRGIAYLHVLQPTLHDEGSKPLSAEERELPPLGRSTDEAIHLAYPRLRALGAELREQGIAFEDASGVFRDVSATLYFDAIHFGEEGNVLLAERIARSFLESAPAR